MKFSEIGEDLIKEALRLIDNGMKDVEIERIIGVSTYHLRKIRDENNRPRSKQWWDKEVTPGQINDIIEMIREGATVQEIHAESGISRKRITEIREVEISEGNLLPEIKLLR